MPTPLDQIWQAALGELELQLTSATFDTWLRHSNAMALEGDTLVVGVPSAYAKDWLDNRLRSMIQRSLMGIMERAVDVRFVVGAPGSAPVEALPASADRIETPAKVIEPAEFMPPDFDSHEAGWFPVSRYECTFWAPLLGRVAWRVWEIVRGNDTRKEKSAWTPERRWSAPELARLVPCGPQAIVGVNRLDGRQGGALERLVARKVGQFRRQGDARDPHTMYTVSVRVRLPLLVAVQVMDLSDTLRHRHDQWLEEHGFDPRDWFVEPRDSEQ